MTHDQERRWDDAIEAAWRDHRHELADRLVVLADRADGEGLEVVAESDEQRLGCRLDRAAAGIRVRLVVEDAPWGTVATARAVMAEVAGTDGEWQPGEPSPGPVLGLAEVDRAAWLVERVLREAFTVPHPSFVTTAADGEGEESDDDQVDHDPAGDGSGTLPDVPAEPWSPDDAPQVRAGLVAAARPLVEGEPVIDDDGDLAIGTRHTVVFVSVATNVPRILIWSTLLTDVADTARALVEVNLLNQRLVGLAFAVVDDRVVVRRELPVGVFVADEVEAELRRVCEEVDDWVADLRSRVGGRAPHDEAPVAPLDRRHTGTSETPGDSRGAGDDRFAAAYAVMRELERDDASLAPEELAHVFHDDRDLLMAAIAATKDSEDEAKRRLRTAEQSGGGRSVALFRAQFRTRRDLRRRLRRALRLTVETRRARADQAQPGLFAEEDVIG